MKLIKKNRWALLLFLGAFAFPGGQKAAAVYWFDIWPVLQIFFVDEKMPGWLEFHEPDRYPIVFRSSNGNGLFLNYVDWSRIETHPNSFEPKEMNKLMLSFKDHEHGNVLLRFTTRWNRKMPLIWEPSGSCNKMPQLVKDIKFLDDGQVPFVPKVDGKGGINNSIMLSLNSNRSVITTTTGVVMQVTEFLDDKTTSLLVDKENLSNPKGHRGTYIIKFVDQHGNIISRKDALVSIRSIRAHFINIRSPESLFHDHIFILDKDGKMVRGTLPTTTPGAASFFATPKSYIGSLSWVQSTKSTFNARTLASGIQSGFSQARAAARTLGKNVAAPTVRSVAQNAFSAARMGCRAVPGAIGGAAEMISGVPKEWWGLSASYYLSRRTLLKSRSNLYNNFRRGTIRVARDNAVRKPGVWTRIKNGRLANFFKGVSLFITGPYYHEDDFEDVPSGMRFQ